MSLKPPTTIPPIVGPHLNHRIVIRYTRRGANGATLADSWKTELEPC